MQTLFLGKIGLRIPAVCLGCMTFGHAPEEEVQPRRAVQALNDIGGARSKTPAQVALAWMLNRPQPVVTVIGMTNVNQSDSISSRLIWANTPLKALLTGPAGRPRRSIYAVVMRPYLLAR